MRGVHLGEIAKRDGDGGDREGENVTEMATFLSPLLRRSRAPRLRKRERVRERNWDFENFNGQSHRVTMRRLVPHSEGSFL